MRNEQLNVKKEVYDKLNFTEQQLMLLTQEMKDKIHRMVEDVEQKVSKALNEEIRRLAVLVDEFSVPFHPEPLVLNVYKRELHMHVENGLGNFEWHTYITRGCCRSQYRREYFAFLRVEFTGQA